MAESCVVILFIRNLEQILKLNFGSLMAYLHGYTRVHALWNWVLDHGVWSMHPWVGGADVDCSRITVQSGSPYSF